jgi:glycosyltransferase involved in cell wall biosynthesis
MNRVRTLVIHHNRAVSCLRTIEAIVGQDLATDIVVLDNGSTAEQLARLRRGLPGIPGLVSMVELGRNKGFGGAANAGLREWLARENGDWVFVAAHDAVPQRGCLRLLLEAVSRRPRAGVASPEYGLGQRPVMSCFRGPYLAPTVRSSGWESAVFVHGTLMALRRACLQEIGLFDERYFAYGDELDLALRARRSGWEVGIVWGSVVENPETSVPSAVACYLQVRNSILVVREHLGRVAALVRWVCVLANTLRLLMVPARAAANHSTVARLRALFDYLRGQFGPPPAIVVRRSRGVEPRPSPFRT